MSIIEVSYDIVIFKIILVIIIIITESGSVLSFQF